VTPLPASNGQALRVTLVCARAAAAQQALTAWLEQAPAAPRAVIVEGALFAFDAAADVSVVRLAAGCVCCLGLVPLRVSLTRLLRSVRPRSLLLIVASDEHLPRLRALLASGDLGSLELVEPAPAGAAISGATLLSTSAK